MCAHVHLKIYVTKILSLQSIPEPQRHTPDSDGSLWSWRLYRNLDLSSGACLNLLRFLALGQVAESREWNKDFEARQMWVKIHSVACTVTRPYQACPSLSPLRDPLLSGCNEITQVHRVSGSQVSVNNGFLHPWLFIWILGPWKTQLASGTVEMPDIFSKKTLFRWAVVLTRVSGTSTYEMGRWGVSRDPNQNSSVWPLSMTENSIGTIWRQIFWPLGYLGGGLEEEASLKG